MHLLFLLPAQPAACLNRELRLNLEEILNVQILEDLVFFRLNNKVLHIICCIERALNIHAAFCIQLNVQWYYV